MSFNVVVAGSRGFNDYRLLCEKLDFLLAKKNDIVVISGTARGADKLGERYAEERGYNVMKFPAKWDEYGKSAGYIRNTEMADHADAVVLFWDGKSRGTMHMRDIAKKNEIPYRIVTY